MLGRTDEAEAVPLPDLAEVVWGGHGTGTLSESDSAAAAEGRRIHLRTSDIYRRKSARSRSSQKARRQPHTAASH